MTWHGCKTGDTPTSNGGLKSAGQGGRAELDLGRKQKANELKEKPVKVIPRHWPGEAALTEGKWAQVGIMKETISGAFSWLGSGSPEFRTKHP